MTQEALVSGTSNPRHQLRGMETLQHILHRCHHRHRHHLNEHAKMFLGFPWSLTIITL